MPELTAPTTTPIGPEPADTAAPGQEGARNDV